MKANEYYNMQRTKAMAELEQRRLEIEQRLPDVSVLSLKKQALFKTRASLLIAGEKPEQIDLQIADYNQQIERLLVTAGYDSSALELKPICALCNDTGFSGNASCSCFLQQDSSSLFDAYDISIFPEGAQREQANILFQFGKEYAENFPKNARPNILISGSTGLGKSFFLNCIASHIHTRGFLTANLTAYQLIQSIMNSVIGKGDYSYLRRLESLPLLVLDDLGSEPFIPNITMEYMFSLINERFQAHRATLIATNLTAADITKRYGTRISSRLFDTHLTRAIKLSGKDIRTTKNFVASST